MQQNTLTVGLNDRAYDIAIGPDLIDRAGEALGPIVANRHIVIISDKNVAKLHLTRLKTSFKSFARKVDHFAIVAGEASKSMAMLSHLLDDILALGVDRSVLLVAFGGGVVGDLAGFAAASLLRGVDFVQIPTSLLAQVDSSVGGKTGVNATAGKNLIGAFYQPKLVLSDISFLKSLSKREFICGFGEVLKYSLIKDKHFFKFIKKNSKKILEGKDLKVLKYLIIRSCKNKVYFVKADEKESGKRMILNFGHTFAHGIEAANNFSKKINHGEAVLMGMFLATKLSVKMKLCSKKVLSEIQNIYTFNKLPSNLNKFFKRNKFKEIVKHMINDKKNNDSKINLILIKKIGKTTQPGKIKISYDKMKIIINDLEDF